METNNRQLSKVSRYNFKKVLNISRHLFQGASTCDGGLQVAFQRDRPHSLVGPQLLLQASERLPSSPSYNVNISRCGNVAAILELDEHLQRDFTIFEAAPQETRGVPAKKPQPDYFL